MVPNDGRRMQVPHKNYYSNVEFLSQLKVAAMDLQVGKLCMGKCLN